MLKPSFQCTSEGQLPDSCDSPEGWSLASPSHKLCPAAHWAPPESEHPSSAYSTQMHCLPVNCSSARPPYINGIEMIHQNPREYHIRVIVSVGHIFNTLSANRLIPSCVTGNLTWYLSGLKPEGRCHLLCMCQLLDEVIATLGATKSKAGVTSDLSQALVPHGTLPSAPHVCFSLQITSRNQVAMCLSMMKKYSSQWSIQKYFIQNARLLSQVVTDIVFCVCLSCP